MLSVTDHCQTSDHSQKQCHALKTIPSNPIIEQETKKYTVLYNLSVDSRGKIGSSAVRATDSFHQRIYHLTQQHNNINDLIDDNRLVRISHHLCRGYTNQFPHPRCYLTSPSLRRFKNVVRENRTECACSFFPISSDEVFCQAAKRCQSEPRMTKSDTSPVSSNVSDFLVQEARKTRWMRKSVHVAMALWASDSFATYGA